MTVQGSASIKTEQENLSTHIALVTSEYLIVLKESGKMMHWVEALMVISTVQGILQDSNKFTPIEDKLSEPPPENKQSWAHPVIFEPQPKIKLTHFSYQVTTFLDFAPQINGFNKVKKYKEDYHRDLQNPAYFERIKHFSTNEDPLLAQDYVAFQGSEYCR